MQLSIGLYSTKPNLSCNVLKDSKGIEKKYIVGTSSGALYRDAHNERMTERCVQGFQQQALSKTIFLIHPHSDNLLENHIGILDAEKSHVNENNEWITYWRLWDTNDAGSIPTRNIEKAIDFYNQINGNPPYTKQTVIKQLSIQGTLDETKDIVMTSHGRDIDWVELDAVSVVTKGAYPQDNITIAEKIFKQVDAMNKQTITIEKYSSLRDKVKESNSTSDFLVETAKLDEALKSLLEEVALDNSLTPEMKEKECKRILGEYANETLSNYKSINFNLQEGEDEMPRKRKEEENQEETPSVKENVDVTTEEKQLFNKEEFMKEIENVMQKFKGDEMSPDQQPSEPMQKDTPDQIQVLQEILATIQEKIAQLGGNSELVEQKSKTTKEDEGQEETEKEDDGFKVDGVIDSGEANAKTPDNQPSTSAKPSAQLEDNPDLDEIISELEKKAGKRLSPTAKQEILNLKKQSSLPKEIRVEIESLKSENASLRKSVATLEEKVSGLIDGLNEFTGSNITTVAKQEVTKQPSKVSLDIDTLEEVVKAFRTQKQEQPKRETFNPKSLFRNTLEQIRG